MFLIANIQSFTSQIFGVVGPLAENLDFFSPLGFDVQTNSNYKTQKIKLYSVRTLKRYLNEKNLIHGRVMAMISEFTPLIFETYFTFLLFYFFTFFPSALTHNSVWMVKWSEVHRLGNLVIVLLRGSSPAMTILFYFSSNFISNKIDLKPNF